MIKSDNLLQLESSLESIPQVEQLIDELSSQYQLSSEIYGKLTLAVVEAVNNAIVHGNEFDEDKFVFLDYTVDSQEIIFRIQDQGDGFDVNQIPDPTSPDNLEKTHGRGIYLMNHLADRLNFDDNGKTVELKFLLN